jgi:hypothetical protein
VLHTAPPQTFCTAYEFATQRSLTLIDTAPLVVTLSSTDNMVFAGRMNMPVHFCALVICWLNLVHCASMKVRFSLSAAIGHRLRHGAAHQMPTCGQRWSADAAHVAFERCQCIHGTKSCTRPSRRARRLATANLAGQPVGWAASRHR